MKLLDEYFNIQKQIYDYFGYKEDWVIIPIDDRRNYVWYLDGDFVNYIEEKNNISEKWHSLEYYADEIYTQRFLPKWVYQAKEFTMICVDTHIDGNKFLAIYDNNKELKINPLQKD
jgi:hypothetical protein